MGSTMGAPGLYESCSIRHCLSFQGNWIQEVTAPPQSHQKRLWKSVPKFNLGRGTRQKSAKISRKPGGGGGGCSATHTRAHIEIARSCLANYQFAKPAFCWSNFREGTRRHHDPLWNQPSSVDSTRIPNRSIRVPNYMMRVLFPSSSKVDLEWHLIGQPT